ncbi:MAG: hypothetical protein JRF33_26400 [Deltaproteobacteria bacterium]|nr:hypothetical protein [Deltaproteobacteria bacterium]
MAWYHTGVRRNLRAHPSMVALRLLRDDEKALGVLGLIEVRERRIEPRKAEIVSVGTEAEKTGYFKEGAIAWVPPALGLEAADGGIVIVDPTEILAVEDST